VGGGLGGKGKSLPGITFQHHLVERGVTCGLYVNVQLFFLLQL
jgi:hypothetical protein